MRIWLVRIVLGVALGLGVSPRVAAGAEGLFADFETSLGNFTCRLEPDYAPLAVANFIGLATGVRPSLDPATGSLRFQRFFDGLTFHRVIPNFMIQGGSPNGMGTDGPGYAFLDEFHPSERHDGPGVLSMANSGPNSNGAQFFVTVAATPWLDDVHTIFGRVIDGQPVVKAISDVPADSSNRPATPVRIERVTIRRVGAAAEAFDIEAQALPKLEGVPLEIAPNGSGIRLQFESPAFGHLHLRESADLKTWSAESLGIQLGTSALETVARPATGSARFYALTRVQYPGSTRAPRDLHGRILTIDFDGALGRLTITFNEQGGGGYRYGEDTGTVTGYSWAQQPYRGQLWPIEFSALVPMTWRLDFATDHQGRFSGTAYTATPVAVSGTFTLSAP